MPRIFDNIELNLLDALRNTLGNCHRADFCVGYFNLRGWKSIDDAIERFQGGDNRCCRLLVGMQRLPQDELRQALRAVDSIEKMDRQTQARLKRMMAEEFRRQLTFGVPTAQDEAALRRLANQLRDRKVMVKLYLSHLLHAKLYLNFRDDPDSPMIGYVGSSNLTFSGLQHQGELNVDVLDHDACGKLAAWFNDRWTDTWSIDITDELEQIIRESWARETAIPPYWIYLKMAYHLSREAREGIQEFRIPRVFGNQLLPFQAAAVRIAAGHLHRRGGVLLGDVVGLGKTLMATALARIFEDDHGIETLIICPKNLTAMWLDYKMRYQLRAEVRSISQVIQQLKDLPRHRLVIIDESHNLRNREGKRFKAIQEYIERNDSRVILLSATPYNKVYHDLSNQLRLFLSDNEDLGIRPEQLLKEIGETEFIKKHQCGVKTLSAFEKSHHPDDWRELMRLYMVRRTRSFIMDNYAIADPSNCRKYLVFDDGSRSYFPERIPKTGKFKMGKGSDDQYTSLYSDNVVKVINRLALPRYGLGNYESKILESPPNQAEARVLADLSRAGRSLKGFCRTNLFKRLESSGEAFILSVKRHILRNFVYLHAIEKNLDLPIGKQDLDMLDGRYGDADAEDEFADDSPSGEEADLSKAGRLPDTLEEFKQLAARIYDEYASRAKNRYKWLRPGLFKPELSDHLKSDAMALFEELHRCGPWRPVDDAKLNALADLLTKTHPKEKVLVFTQFADTVEYLKRELGNRKVDSLEGVTGDAENPTAFAWRFSPESNKKRADISKQEELRVLIATDVLSEGQNLQDCAVVINYDLPWAIIRLIQRAGRVDRIGQKADRILCYSFLPADGVERIIQLRARVRQRLKENAEVLGTDESFFEEERANQSIRDLFTEKAGILNGDEDSEVDLASYAWQIWKNAVEKDPGLEDKVVSLPPVVYTTKAHKPRADGPEGSLVYVKTPHGNDALAWVDKVGKSVTESQLAVLKAAECVPDAESLPRLPNHHELVAEAVRQISAQESTMGGQLGRPSGARFKTYERLKNHIERQSGTLFDTPALQRAVEDIYKYPLTSTATDTLNRLLRAGASDDELADRVVSMREEGKLSVILKDGQDRDPQIICSLGLREAPPA